MRPAFIDGLTLSLVLILQFLMEVTLGRVLAAPNLLVPLIVYLNMNREADWAGRGAFFSGLCLDLLLNHPPGTSSLAIILGILAARSVLSATTAMGGISFYANALLASIFSDTLFITFASRPPGVFLGVRTLLVIPRAAVPLIFLMGAQLVFFRIRGRTA